VTVTSPRPPRTDGSMSLLVDMMRDAQDPAYAAAAGVRADRTGRRPAPRPPRRVALGVLVLTLVGLVTGAAAAALRAAPADGEQVRARLVSEVQQRTADSERLRAEAAALRTEVGGQRDAALARDAQGRQQASALRALELAAAAVPVAGPGVVVVVDDRPDGGGAPALPRGGQVGDGRVLDRDLQALVNGLWAAGAEAVSVNDLRLGARTAIRSAGQAVLVDFRPISPPYVVRALGDPGRLEAEYADGVAGRRLATYASLYGLPYDVRSEARLRLPAASVPDLRSAVAAP